MKKVVVDAVTKTVRCETCGDEIPQPLGSLIWVADVLKAFAEAHKGCRGSGGRTSFAEPVDDK